MPYTPVIVERFGALNLAADPSELGFNGAIDLLNADVTPNLSKVGTRGGLTRLVTGTTRYHRIAPYIRADDATGDVVASPYLALLRNTGAALQLAYTPITSPAVVSGGTWGGATTVATSHAASGDIVDANTYILVASRSGDRNEEVRFFSYENVTNAFLVYVNMTGRPRYVAITPWDSRIAQAQFTRPTDSPTGANGSKSTVFFSNPGPVLSYGADDWVAVGDTSEEITGVVVFRNEMYVIKETAMYVFYGTSTDATGGAIFNYRRIQLPAQARKTATGGGENIIAAADGVYLLLSDGVYRTSGGEPALVSKDVAPIFDGTGDASMLFPTSSTADWTIGYHANRVYLSYQVGSTYRTLVYDVALGQWLLWDLSAGQSALPTNVITGVDVNGLPVGYLASGGRVFALSKTATSDDGTAIASHYQTGFQTVADGASARMRRFELTGTGTVSHATASDFGAVGTSASVVMGTSPAMARAYDLRAARACSLSFRASATSGAWSIGRWTALIADARHR